MENHRKCVMSRVLLQYYSFMYIYNFLQFIVFKKNWCWEKDDKINQNSA